MQLIFDYLLIIYIITQSKAQKIKKDEFDN